MGALLKFTVGGGCLNWEPCIQKKVVLNGDGMEGEGVVERDRERQLFVFTSFRFPPPLAAAAAATAGQSNGRGGG